MKIMISTVSLSLLLPVLASAATYHVSAFGTDAHSCKQSQSPRSPKKTIQEGFNCVSPGDTVLVSGGTYEESVTLTKSGRKGKPIILKAKPGETVIWRSRHADPKKGAITISQQSFLRIEGFVFEGTPARTTLLVRNTPRKKETAPVQGIEIVRNKFLNNGGPANESRIIYFISTGHRTFDGGDTQNIVAENTFSGNYGRSISLLASSDTVVHRNTCTNQKGSARRNALYSARFIQIGGEDRQKNNSERNIVEQNTIHDFVVQPYVGSARNALQAIKLDANADRNVIRDNLIYNLDAKNHKSSEGIFLESRCDNNLISGNIVHTIGGSCYRDGSKGTVVTLRNQWINNVGYNCECGLSLSHARNSIVRNNIFVLNKNAQIYVTDKSVFEGEHRFSNNLYYPPHEKNINTWNGTATSCGTATHTFFSWTSASEDTNSLIYNSQLVNIR